MGVDTWLAAATAGALDRPWRRSRVRGPCHPAHHARRGGRGRPGHGAGNAPREDIPSATPTPSGPDSPDSAPTALASDVPPQTADRSDRPDCAAHNTRIMRFPPSGRGKTTTRS